MKNGLLEPGDIVRYSPVIGEPPQERTYTVRELARLEHGEVVAFLNGKSGCVSLSALTFVELSCDCCEGICQTPYTCPNCKHVRPCGDGSHCQNCFQSNDPDSTDESRRTA